MRISSNRSQTESNLRDEKRKTYMIDTRVTKCNEREEVVELLLFERVAPPFLKRKKETNAGANSNNVHRLATEP